MNMETYALARSVISSKRTLANDMMSEATKLDERAAMLRKMAIKEIDAADDMENRLASRKEADDGR